MKQAKSSKHTCPITRPAELLSDSWTILIMRALNEGPKHFNELQTWLHDISSRTLSKKLQRLLKERLIGKTRAGIYHSTKKGQGLKIIERAMVEYAKKYL